MRQILILLILVLFGSASCRKFVWDNPNDTTNPTSDLTSLKNGLVAYYPFNGNANDESGNGNNGLNNGATLIEDRFDIDNRAYSFNGISDFITLPLLTVLNNSKVASISFWIKEPIDDGAIFGHFGNNFGAVGANPGFVVALSQNKIAASNYSGCCPQISSILSKSLAWNHVVVLFDGSKANSQRISFYLNGVFATETIGLSNSVIGNATSTFIGRRNTDRDTFGDYFRGKLDEIRIYSRALTQEEITYLANN